MTATCHTPKPLRGPSWQYSTPPILHQPTWDSKNRGRWGHAHIPSPNSKAYSVDIYPTSHIHLHSDIATSTTLINTSHIHSHTHKLMSTHTLTCIPPRAQRRYSLMLTQSHYPHTHLALPPGLQDTGQPSGLQEVAPGQAQDTCSESWGNTASKANILGAEATDARWGPGGPAAGSYRVTCFLLGSTCRKGVASAACTGQIRSRTFTCGSVELVSMGPGISARWGKARVQDMSQDRVQGHGGSTETQNMGGTWGHGQRVMEDTAGTWGHRDIGGVKKGAERPGAGRTGQAESVWPVEEKRCLWPPHVQVPKVPVVPPWPRQDQDFQGLRALPCLSLCPPRAGTGAGCARGSAGLGPAE